MLVQRCFHANNLTENEYVTASPAQDCCVIERDWLTMIANEDTADQSSIPALCQVTVNVDKSFRTARKTEIVELGHKAFLKNIVFISFSAGCSSEFLGKIDLFIFYSSQDAQFGWGPL